MTKAIPQGMHTLTPHLCIKDAAQAIEFYKKAFDAKEEARFLGQDGKSIMHARLLIGDSVLFVSDEMPSPNCRTKSAASAGTCTSVIHMYVENADAVFERAIKAGAEVSLPLMDAFWGDRYGQFVDPTGQVWSIATHIKDVTEDEMKKGRDEMCARMTAGAQK